MTPLESDIVNRIGHLPEPSLNWRIMDLNLIREIRVSDDDSLVIRIELIEADPEKTESFRKAVLAELADLPHVRKSVRIDRADISSHGLRDVKQIYLVGSGKGGVGKSTVSVNIAAALAARGLRVGILDADIYGPSIPLLLGCHESPQVLAQELLMPLEAHGMRFISMGSLVSRNQALAWRGQLVSGTILQFIRRVNWGKLDFLIVDLPPGTGDVQLTLAGELTSAGALVVTTPQHVAREDVQRCITMFEDLKIPMVGLVENMVSWACEKCGHVQPVFAGSGDRWCELETIAVIPMDRQVWDSSEKGIPLVLNGMPHSLGMIFDRIAARLAFGQ